jgi:hypothetical protein
MYLLFDEKEAKTFGSLTIEEVVVTFVFLQLVEPLSLVFFLQPTHQVI